MPPSEFSINPSDSSSTKSQTRLTPTAVGSEWIQINSTGSILERWTWNGSIYLGELKSKELPDSSLYPTSVGGSLGVFTINEDILVERVIWCPYCSPGIYNSSNYWTINILSINSPDLLLNNASLASYQRIKLSATVSIPVASASLVAGISLVMNGSPPEIYPGPVNINYRPRKA